ncbi:uncharacterized protein LOC128713035 [Anopheles marshallii]|uniref:uncharacterized protein LOC128713035 n=1 Tax=Anopheles marshallii TaxID=1521116 RepID=UPI00237ABC51|nr:uncharacterized protein LOC128713035 [Anopheles marshallii]
MDRTRFSISLLCEQISKTCRLCGVDNPDKIPILGAESFIASDEPPLAKKIELCIGIKVTLKDKMPQLICSLCVDKMNDFYEYRVMCETTDLEIRKILHLPMAQPAALLMPKAEPEITAIITLDDEDVDVKPSVKRGPKTRNQKKQLEADEPGNSEEADIKPVLDEPSEKRSKYDFPCQYCNESFIQSSELERHRVVKHTPLVHKFGCGTCMEYFDTATEFKDHNLWHKLTRTAFGCFRCGKKFVKTSTLNKHVSLNACIRLPRVSHEVTLVPDMQCQLCQKIFKTRNLYEWHGCFIRARSNCPKCGRNFLKKNLLMRHFILYCNGSFPILDPIMVPKDEPGTGSINGQPGSSGTEVKRRGRPPRAVSSMKEETIDLPLPPLLDLPELKSESNSMPDGHNSTECTMSGTETEDNHKRSSLIEETNKITTLLRSGESVDGNTDLSTISSMLSSVNEAIATISKVRKKKKKRGRLSSSGTGVAGDASENPPMVVLSKANVKQELHEDSNMLATLVANSAGMENGLNEATTANDDHREAEGAESEQDVDDYDNAAESFAHHNDDAGDSDSDVEIISVEQYQPTGTGTLFTSNWNDMMRPNDESAQPMEVQVKQEPTATNDGGDESDFEGYEDASMFVAVKQEPVEETVEMSPVEQCSVVEKQHEASLSSYQALRIKIKKEKGWLNASVVGEEPATIDPISTPEEQPDKRQTRGDGTTKKPTKTSTKRTSNSPALPADPKRCLRTSTSGLNASIKQEPMEAEDGDLQESVTDYQDYPPEATFIDTTTVRIKQEPQEDNSPGSPAEDVITFDGKRIKRERLDDDPASHSKQASSDDCYKKLLNPLSLSGVRIAAGKKSANSQSSVSVNKSSVMINPFALLKQQESVPNVTEQESASKDSTDSSADQSERFGLPVISQVKSIDPVEHLSLTSEDNVAAERTPVVEQQQKETTVEMDRNDGTNNLRHTDSPPMSEPSVSESVPVASPQKNVTELKITSVTTISEDIVPLPQEKNSPTTTNLEDIVPPHENVGELKTLSVTTSAQDLVPHQANVSELKISSVTTIPEVMEQDFHSEDTYNEQQMSADDVKNSNANAMPEGVPERDDSEDLISLQATKNAETTSRSDVNDHVETVDSCQDDGKCTVDEHNDDDEDKEQKTSINEEEKQEKDSVASESSKKMPENMVATSTEHEQQQPNNHDTVVAADTTGDIEATAETDVADVNINPVTCSEQHQELPPAESSREKEVQPDTQKEVCAVASNEEVLAAKQ